jgi:DNA-binding response OmpR family regulator
MNQGRLLLVEDDRAITGPLVRALEREGYEVDAVGSGRDALACADQGTHHLVLLDLGLPDIDGIDVCRRLRTDHPSLPVLMLTARTDEVDTVVGLDAGADDYVTKPFRLAELLARVRALLRRSTAPGAGELSVAGVRVDPASRRAWRDDRELELTPKEFDLLWLLVSQPGMVVPRDRIMAEVWDINWFGSTKTLDMHVSWLRRKLHDDPADPQLIQTVRGVGYRFAED